METINERICRELLEMQDLPYKDFHANLMPTVDRERVIGIRVPVLRKYAKTAAKDPDIDRFLDELPHYYFEENNVHAFVIEQIRDYETCLKRVKEFLPYIDNWATCDMMNPKVFGKYTDELWREAQSWIGSDQTYTIRFGIGMVMRYFLEERFEPVCLETVASVRSEEYYVNMMVAWFFATALAKQYEQTLPFIEEQRLQCWTHNKAIQKACESYRITKEQKEYLKTLKRKQKSEEKT